MIWPALASVATGISAIVTAAMAWMTWQMIAQSRGHHKDEFRPILSLAPEGSADPVRRDRILRAEPAQPQNPERCYVLHAALANIGRGPALNIKLTVRFLGIEGYGVIAEIAPVGSGARIHFGEQGLRVGVRLHERFNDADFQLGPGSTWEILLEYEDVFGQRFHTVHAKNPGQRWTVIGRGPAPQGRDPDEVQRELQAVAVPDSESRESLP